MKRQIALMLALSLGVLLVTAESPAHAAGRKQYGWVTAPMRIPPGESYTVKLTEVLISSYVIVTRNVHAAPSCQGSGCTSGVASQTVSGRIRLEPGEAITIAVAPELESVSFSFTATTPNLAVTVERRDAAGGYLGSMPVRSLGPLAP